MAQHAKHERDAVPPARPSIHHHHYGSPTAAAPPPSTSYTSASASSETSMTPPVVGPSTSAVPIIFDDAASIRTVSYVRADGTGLCRDGMPHEWEVRRPTWSAFLCCLCLCLTPRYHKCKRCGVVIS